MKIYGIFEKDDVIKEGDEFFDPDLKRWIPCRFEHFGLKFKPDKYQDTRRPLGNIQGIVEAIDNMPISCGKCRQLHSNGRLCLLSPNHCVRLASDFYTEDKPE